MRLRRKAARSVLAALLAVAATAAACASGRTGGSESPGRSSSTRITAQELTDIGQFDLHTAITRLRPGWLQPGTRGVLPGVIVNGTPQFDGVERLRSLRAGETTLVEYMSAVDATTRFGTGYPGGAILVTTGR